MTETPQPLEGIIVSAEADQLATIQSRPTLEVFTAPGVVPALLARIREVALDGYAPDLTTDAGRKAIASRAFRVAKTKTALDDLGKEEVARLKELPKAVDAGRKALRDGLDALRDEIRQPLTAWEEKREALKADLARIQNGPAALFTAPAAQIREAITKLEALPVGPERWEELAGEAEAVRRVTLLTLEEMAEKAQKREEDAAELERLRIEKAKRDKEDADEKLRKEGEERARAQTAAPAPAPAPQPEPQAPAAQTAADQQAHPPVPNPPMREAALPPSAGPAADLEHRRAFNREALADLVDLLVRVPAGAPAPKVAEEILRGIVAGKVRHLSITY